MVSKLTRLAAKSQKYGIKNVPTKLDSLETFTEKGPVPYADRIEAYDEAYAVLEREAGQTILESRPDQTYAEGLAEGGWTRNDAIANAIEWYECDFEYAEKSVSFRVKSSI